MYTLVHAHTAKIPISLFSLHKHSRVNRTNGKHPSELRKIEMWQMNFTKEDFQFELDVYCIHYRCYRRQICSKSRKLMAETREESARRKTWQLSPSEEQQRKEITNLCLFFHRTSALILELEVKEQRLNLNSWFQ